jgi:hypothetical protein
MAGIIVFHSEVSGNLLAKKHTASVFQILAAKKIEYVFQCST